MVDNSDGPGFQDRCMDYCASQLPRPEPLKFDPKGPEDLRAVQQGSGGVVVDMGGGSGGPAGGSAVTGRNTPGAPGRPSQRTGPDQRQTQQQQPNQTSGSNAEPRNQTQTDDALNPTRPPSEAQFDEMLRQCEDAEKRARQCCNSPIQCIDSESTIGGGEMAVIGGLVSAGLVIAGQGQGGMAQQCRNAELLGYGSAGMNAAMMGVCSMKKNECESTCEELQRTYQATYGTNAGRSPSSSAGVSRTDQLTRITAKIRQCRSYNTNISQMGQQAVAGGLAAAMAQACQKAVAPSSTGFDDFNAKNLFNNDCTDPANASNPMCQSVCARPGAENNPICRTNSATDSTTGGNTGGGNNIFGDRPTANVGLGDGAPTQEGVTGGAPSQQVRANGVNGAPSNFAGNGAPMQPAGAQGGGGGQGGSGYDTNVLRGVGSGSGYSTSAGGALSGGGGFAGYGSGTRAPSNAAPFDLKNYLPGGGNMNRKIAGSADGSIVATEIGGKHDNIFRRISLRFYQLCLNDRLLDCETDLKAMRKQLSSPN